jgi:hypothetical protein
VELLKAEIQAEVADAVVLLTRAPDRHIWQLADHDKLVAAWRRLDGEDPANEEKRMVAEFKAVFCSLPFANLRHCLKAQRRRPLNPEA